MIIIGYYFDNFDNNRDIDISLVFMPGCFRNAGIFAGNMVKSSAWMMLLHANKALVSNIND